MVYLYFSIMVCDLYNIILIMVVTYYSCMMYVQADTRYKNCLDCIIYVRFTGTNLLWSYSIIGKN